jgi:hypothetical protein
MIRVIRGQKSDQMKPRITRITQMSRDAQMSCQIEGNSEYLCINYWIPACAEMTDHPNARNLRSS